VHTFTGRAWAGKGAQERTGVRHLNDSTTQILIVMLPFVCLFVCLFACLYVVVFCSPFLVFVVVM